MRWTMSVWRDRRTVSTLGDGDVSTVGGEGGVTLGSGRGILWITVVGASVGGVVVFGSASSKMVASCFRLDSKVVGRWKGEEG